MILSRSKPAISNESTGAIPKTNTNKNIAEFQENLRNRDYTGAITILEFLKSQELKANPNIDLWLAYSAFHQGDYQKALQIYKNLQKTDEKFENLDVNIACCYFYLGMYDESKQSLENVPQTGLSNRLNFHLSHKLKDEASLMEFHQKLEDVIEDQLSLAAIHYLRSHYQEAIDVYKRLLLQNGENLALNVYVALCYYKLDYYDISQEVLNVYLNNYPDSIVATNLKACNSFRMFKGAAAESELRPIIDASQNGFTYDLVRHNQVVFRDGEGALQIFPNLVGIVPEARLNLVIYFLRNNDIKEAYDLIKDLQPAVPQEYIIKGVVNAALGQEINSIDHVKTAIECFHLVGSSTSECDTIYGRQCMAASYFLENQFEEVLIFLTSIKSYFHSDDTFNYNFGQAKTSCHQFKEAEEIFLLIKDPSFKNDYVYISNLARCYIMNKKAQQAWELYIKMEASPESFNLLLLIANDCYKMGEFWYAAKAFDMLDRLDPNPEFWEGKRGAIVGVFQGVIAQKFSGDLLGDCLQLLRSSSSSQAEQIAKCIRRWAKDKRVALN